ncbi:Inositol-phosphate phosphatase [Chlorobium limicola DSM 245]|uniref:Inositol-1-monophosphatase n=1 Tax=Chlorobium limicola (strain DSM 245 / NBRC 103803 / 6330) TaxID=290315 RepID=B3EGL6_CHLL2|nr:inositol monophosphatase family protein [Chlorobium limicola]ACD89653.1 Inositol-phosphate phosphatase [Chlorobium limicola DSM 245]
MSRELDTAVKAAMAAGEITLGKFGELSSPEIMAKEFKDFVTEVDKACEAAISSLITASFPDDSLLCEEGTIANGSSGRTWIVDPLDGTLNFIHSFPVFSISIALCNPEGDILCGVVYQPLLRELFTAEKGCGAFLNGKAITVSSRTGREEFLVATGIPFKEYHYLEFYMCMLKDVIRDSAGIRRAGSAAIDLAYTACGRFDGFWEYRLFPWDFAAGVLLVREAGGTVTDFGGNHNVFLRQSIIAGNATTHPMLLEKALNHFSEERSSK